MIEDRLAQVSARIRDAARRAGRDPDEITLVAVAKGMPAEAVAEVASLGVLDIGENRAQELGAKREALAGDPRAERIRWHFVGVLQRNKVRAVVPGVALVHSVDSVALAERIARRAAGAGVAQDVLLEVNVGEDPAKAGVAAADAPRLVAHVAGLEGVRLRGLMTIPPLEGDPRPHFSGLRRLRDELSGAASGITELSMGMSADFEIAVEEGATIVRIGTAIFGPRPA